MLNLLLPLLNLLSVAVVLILLSRRAFAQELPSPRTPDPIFFSHQPDHYLALDLLVFSQWDDGGNPLVDEGFRDEAVSFEFRLKHTDQLATRGTAVISYLQNDPLMTLPSSIVNSHISAASTDFVTLDASLAADLISSDGKLVISPGLFYHHQWAYIAEGLDLDVRRIFADGDSILRLAYSGRYARLGQVHWDGAPVVSDDRITHNFILGLTQILSSRLVMSAGLQYTRQDGLLSSTLQFVGLYNTAEQPVLLVDEVLPRVRNRGQGNLRFRYTPSVGTGLGLDLSGYYDDWELLNVAVEPSFETPLTLAGRDARIRLWYRVADQKATEYFMATPTALQPYMTQNSNLGSFVMQTPGLTVLLPMGDGLGPRWILRTTLLGFYRSDRIFGMGGSVGTSVEW